MVICKWAYRQRVPHPAIYILPWEGNISSPCTLDIHQTSTVGGGYLLTTSKDNNAMPFVPAPRTVKAELFFTQDGQRVENVLHFQFDSLVTAEDMENLGEALVSWWDTVMQPIVSNTVQLTAVKMTDLTTETSPVLEYTEGLPLTGTLTTAALPNNVTVVIKWITAKRGRSFRGRTYHIGMLASQVLGNTLVNTFRTALTSAYSALTIPAGTANGVLSVVSYISNGSTRSVAEVTPVIGLTINPTVDSQRRRLPERGS